MHSEAASAALRDIAYQIELALSFVEGLDQEHFGPIYARSMR